MSNVKISELPASTTPLTGGELVPIVQSGITKNVSVDNLTAGKSISVSGITTSGTALTMTGSTASGSGLVLAPQMVRLNADRQKVNNDTTLEAIFDSGNDSLALAADTLYHFRGVLYFTKTATLASVNITLGFSFSQTQQNIAYSAIANGAASAYCARITGVGPNSIGLSTTGTQTTTATIEGFFKSNATTGGTVTPQFAQGQAGTTAAPSVLAGSFIMIQPMSSDVNATVLAGNWS